MRRLFLLHSRFRVAAFFEGLYIHALKCANLGIYIKYMRVFLFVHAGIVSLTIILLVPKNAWGPINPDSALFLVSVSSTPGTQSKVTLFLAPRRSKNRNIIPITKIRWLNNHYVSL